MVRCIIRLLGAQYELSDFSLWIFGCLYSSNSALILGWSSNPKQAWQILMVPGHWQLPGKLKNPGHLIASGHVSMTIWSRLGLDRQAQIGLFDRMRTGAITGVNLVPKMGSPFSIS